ncbi:MAG: DNA-directed RNA polymerase subunit omega [Nitrospirota bacterium]
MDLISLPIEKNENRFRLVMAVIKRAKALYQGAMPRIDSKSKKMTSIALEEIISGSINVLSGEAAVKAEEEAKRITYQNMMDEAKQKASFPEEMTKIEKDLQVYLREKEEVVVENTT